MSEWRKKQGKDVFYIKAKEEGYRSRAAYKLLEMQKKFNLIHKHASVLDLGCAPGGWLQVAKKYTDGTIIGIDLQYMEPVQKVHFGQFDFTDHDKLNLFLAEVHAPQTFSVILSDMSPMISGDRETDHFESVELTETVFEFSKTRLEVGGYMVCKLFDGQDTNQLLSRLKQNMSVKIFKPEASRSDSREVYIVCKKR